MTAQWRRYQADAAAYFSSLGLRTEVGAKIDGARGRHEIDVLVTGRIFGLNLRWVLECQHWSSNIPKEKVLALQAIVQDVGADRGILLSEIGFQSGAIRVANLPNITLTSLADLRSQTPQPIAEEVVVSLHWRLTRVSSRLSRMHRSQKENAHVTPALSEKAKIMFIDSAFEEALRGELPTIYAAGPDDTRLAADTLEELILKADELISAAEKYAEHEDNEQSK